MNGSLGHSSGTYHFGNSLIGLNGQAGIAAETNQAGQRDPGPGGQEAAAEEARAHGDHSREAAKTATAARFLGYIAFVFALFSAGYMLSLVLTGCATARPQVEQALTTAGECLAEKAAQCAVLTLASCSGLPSRAEIYACVQTTYPGCVVASATMCATGAWEGLPAATVTP